ncbi:P-loop containing nucleoside triphosphate hydrolase protein [Rhizophagus irregularis]|uniref:DNA 3'-5' helicase n=1 Tax=Rhizophagus irregularis TaxID=588596 RepID=A0A2I1GHZ6_9GLOM|nr:P-loop containing nucleoside triphosphate hydrolase protein [Rhizophagus irregularis]
MCESALSGIFQFSEFRNGQKDAIKSFVQNYDTLVLKQTGGGKSLCYALPSVIATGITVVFSPLKALVDDQVLELIKVGIPCGGLYASTAQPIWYQRKVFQEIACGLTRVIITTPEKFKFNVGFRQMLEQIGISRGIRFVIDEAHCILDQEHFRDSWSFLCNLKKIFPTAPILLLTATCRMIDAQEIVTRLGIDHQRMFLFRDKLKPLLIHVFFFLLFLVKNLLYLKITSEIEAGKCIIYCISIKECENLLTNLQAKVRKEEIAIYHGKLPAKEKSNALSLWKSIKIRIIVATNAFGMGVNEPDVRVVIHAGFPISMGNGRAGRDGLPAKAIIMFSRKDIRTAMGVYMKGKER